MYGFISGEEASSCAPGSEMRFLMGILWMLSSAMMVAPGRSLAGIRVIFPRLFNATLLEIFSRFFEHVSQWVRCAGLLLLRLCVSGLLDRKSTRLNSSHLG